MPLGKIIVTEELLQQENIFNFLSDNFDILLVYKNEFYYGCKILLCDSRYFETLNEDDEIPFYEIIVKSDIHKNIWVAQCNKILF